MQLIPESRLPPCYRYLSLCRCPPLSSPSSFRLTSLHAPGIMSTSAHRICPLLRVNCLVRLLRSVTFRRPPRLTIIMVRP